MGELDTEWWCTDYPVGGRNIAAPYSRSQDINVDLTTSPSKKYRSNYLTIAVKEKKKGKQRIYPIGTSESYRKPENSITLLVCIT